MDEEEVWLVLFDVSCGFCGCVVFRVVGVDVFEVVAIKAIDIILDGFPLVLHAYLCFGICLPYDVEDGGEESVLCGGNWDDGGSVGIVHDAVHTGWCGCELRAPVGSAYGGDDGACLCGVGSLAHEFSYVFHFTVDGVAESVCSPSVYANPQDVCGAPCFGVMVSLCVSGQEERQGYE